jgi:hypothetical protein
MLCDVPAFLGTDGENYVLSKDDVVLVPDAIAKVLCNRNLAMVDVSQPPE